MGWGRSWRSLPPLPVSALRRSQGPAKHLLYDMFVCRTDSVIFVLICRAQAYFGFSELPGQDEEDIAHPGVCRTIWKEQCRKLLQVSWGFNQISCLVCTSSSSGMKRVGFALFAPELRCKLENAPGID
jgi:hypothetical protein